MTASLGRSFDMKNLKSAGLIVGGGLANVTLTSLLSRVVTGAVPAVASIPGYQYLAGLVGAAGVGMVGNMVAPRYSSELFIGALAQPIGLLAKNLMEGSLGLTDFLIEPQLRAATQLSGMHDFLVQPQLTAATQLRGMHGMHGMADIAYDEGMGGF